MGIPIHQGVASVQQPGANSDRPVTVRDLRMGHVHLTEGLKEQIRQRVAPILARVAWRLIIEQREAEKGANSVAHDSRGQ